MKQKLLHTYLLACASICVSSYTILCAEQTTHQSVSEKRDEQDQKNYVFEYHKVLNIFDRTRSFLEFLGQAVNKGSVGIHNPKLVRIWIQNHLKNIDFLYKKNPLFVSSKDVAFALKAMSHILNNIHIAVESSLKHITFEPVKQKMRGRLDLSTDYINDDIMYNQFKIENIEKTSETIGLSYINICARKIESLNDTYNFLPALKFTAVATGCAIAGSYIGFDNTWLDDNKRNAPDMTKFKRRILPIIRNLKKITGRQPEYDEHGVITNSDNIGICGMFHDMLRSIPSNAHKAGSLMATPALFFYKDQIYELRDSVKNIVSHSWEMLKGYNLPVNKKSQSSYHIEDAITLDDERLIGLDDQIKQLKDLALYITEPDIFDRQGVSLGKGILLTGPSRSGKTLTAQALSGSINKILRDKGSRKSFGFKNVNFMDLMWGKNALENIIEEARENAPCILFIDEIHNLNLQEGGFNKTLNEFLTTMSGINQESGLGKQVIILGATNKAERLDSALLQPGRFGKIIQFEKPKYEHRKHFFAVMLKRHMINAEEFNLDLIARQTSGCTCGDLDEILKESRFQARKEGSRLSQNHIQHNIEKHMHKIKSTSTLTAHEQKTVAAHHAGMALTYMYKKAEGEIIYATTKTYDTDIHERHWFLDKPDNKPRPKKKDYGKIVCYNSSESIDIETEESLRKQAYVYLSGRVAQRIILGSCSYSYKNDDFEHALSCIKKSLLKGFKEEDLSTEDHNIIKNRTRTIVTEHEDELYQEMSTTYKKQLVSLYKELLTRQTLFYEDMNRICNMNRK
jgi:cell division protease FtsH